jgi:DNA polymerase IV
MKLHIDIDCFFVSAERIYAPNFAKVPLAVGGRSNLSIFSGTNSPKYISNIGGAFTSRLLSEKDTRGFEEYFVDKNGKKRGIVTTASYEARAYGVKTAMSIGESLRLCPNLIVLPPNYPLYHSLSNQLKKLLEKHIPLIEQFSIDEFFGDITGWIKEEDIYSFGKSLQKEVLDTLKLPVSIGIAESKWIAKLATEFAKPKGVKYISHENMESFLKDIPIEEFPGIGERYHQRLKGYGIATLGDAKRNKELFYSWKEPGIKLYHRICGDDKEKVVVETSKKSIGIGRSFDPEFDRKEIKRRILIFCRHLSFLAYKGEHNPLKFHLKVKYQYGEKSKGFINSPRLFHESHLKSSMIELFDALDKHPSHGVIQLQMTLLDFEKVHDKTLDIFHYEKDREKQNLMDSMHKLREKFGVDIIKTGGELI